MELLEEVPGLTKFYPECRLLGIERPEVLFYRGGLRVIIDVQSRPIPRGVKKIKKKYQETYKLKGEIHINPEFVL